MPTDPPLPDWVAPSRQALGRHIARQRYARHLTVDDVAERTGLNRKSVIHAENATVVPSVVTLMLIAHALGMTLAELVDYGPAAAAGACGGGA